MLASLANGVIFKKAFSDTTVFNGFIHDVLGLDLAIQTIETEKRFSPKIGGIDFAYDVFAESDDHRVIIEMQRVEYDYNFDRFLHYHLMGITELQRNAKEYKIDQTVFTIVFLTAPFKIDQKTGIPIRDEVLISRVDPRNLLGEEIKIYGHELIFLNPNYKKKKTPQPYRDWLDLIYESIHNPESYKVNLNNQGVKQAVGLIDYNHLTPVELREMKEHEGRVATLKIAQHELEKVEQALSQEKNRAEQEKSRAEQEKGRAEQEKSRAEQEKGRAEQEKSRAEQEKNRAEQEKNRAEQEKSRAEQEKSRADQMEEENKRLKALLDAKS